MKKYNFNAGPSVLPEVVLQQAAKAIIDFDSTGLSLLSISHRTPEFEAVVEEAKSLMKELLGIPDNYKIYFVGGGASTQFFHIPANFLAKEAGYVHTGVWTKKAIKEAKFYGKVEVVASSEDRNFTYIPKGFEIPEDLDYLYICANNTIYGTEYKMDIDSPVPVIADMSSNILSRPIDVSKYAMIYGGAQKNLAPAGVSFVIIRDDMLQKVARPLPTMMNVNTHVENDSMFNTPPVFPIYVLRETLKWMKAEGGLEEIYRRNVEKAALLYGEIDRNSLFKGTVAEEDRSLMNICFVMSEGNEALAPEFMEFAKSRGMVGIKGHRLVGGFRASCYNACPVEAVEALVCGRRSLKEPLFVTYKGTALYPSYVDRVMKSELKGVKGITGRRSPHVLRHSIATGLMNEDVHLNSIKEMLGHSSLASTQVYTHTSIARLKTIYEQAHPRAKNGGKHGD